MKTKVETLADFDNPEESYWELKRQIETFKGSTNPLDIIMREALELECKLYEGVRRLN